VSLSLSRLSEHSGNAGLFSLLSVIEMQPGSAGKSTSPSPSLSLPSEHCGDGGDGGSASSSSASEAQSGSAGDWGISGSFDALSIHPYSHDRSPLAGGDPRVSFALGVPAVRDVMLRNGNTAPMWLTESGWSTSNTRS